MPGRQPQYQLNESDRNLLADLLADYRRSRPPHANRGAFFQELGESPDVYFAKTPTGGIPALAAGPPAVPGSAECSIYEEVPTGSGNAVNLTDTGFTRVVYNPNTSAVAGSAFVPVLRTKYGRWVVASPPATGGAVSGSGTTDRLAKWVNSTTLGASLVQDGGSSGQFVKALTRFQWTVISRTGITGTLNDYDPWTAGGYGNVLQLSPSGAVTLNGLVGGLEGMPLLIQVPAGSAAAVTLNHLNAGSAGANQFRLAGAAITLSIGGRPILLTYLDGKWAMPVTA